MDNYGSSIPLPEDIVAEILVRLHVRPLFRFKLVSKRWKCIISDPKFAKYYLQRARSSPKSSALWRHWGILFTYLNNCDKPRCLPSNDRDFSKPVSDIHDIDHASLSLYESVYSTYTSWKHKNLHEILSSSNGLVLSRVPPTSLYKKGEHNWQKWSLELCVSNPLTKQSVKLPLLWVPYFPQAFGPFGLATRAAQPEGENPAYISYKVVVIRSAKRRVNFAWPFNLITIMIFSSDTGKWTRQDLIRCPTSILMCTVLESFTCRGILHWFEYNRRSIVTYDPYDSPDRFGRIQLPDAPGNMLSGLHVMHSGHEDLLKYAEVELCGEYDRRLHVWCLADYANGEWRLEQTFPVSPYLEDFKLRDCSKLIAPDPWNDNFWCLLYETENMVKAIDLGSAEVVYGDPSKVMAETAYWLETALIVNISLCPWSSPYNARAQSNTSTEVGFRKITAAWFPS